MKSLGLTYSAEVHLRGLEILVTENHFGDDLKGYPVPTRVGGRMASEIVRPDLHVHLIPEPFDHGSRRRVTDRKESVVRTDIRASMYACSLPASVSGMKALSSSRPDFGRLSVSLLPFTSDARKLSTSPILRPQRAWSSRITCPSASGSGK